MTTDEGDTVLDPFVGTGTTAIAAKRLGRNSIGIDIDPKYVELTKEKLKGVIPSRINDCYVSVFLGKVVTVRDADYEKIKPLLKTKDLRINSVGHKELTLPTLNNVMPQRSIKKLIDVGLDNVKPKLVVPELVPQARLMEKKAAYKTEKPGKKSVLTHDQR